MAGRIFFYYCFLLVLFLIISAIINSSKSGSVIMQILFFPLVLYFLLTFRQRVQKNYRIPKLLQKILVYYNFIVVSLMTMVGFISSQNPSQILSATLFLPLAIYFILRVLPKRSQALPVYLPSASDYLSPLAVQPLSKMSKSKKEFSDILPPKRGGNLDFDRRMFIKLIGSAGLTVFLFSLFTNKAHAAFFGSVPGPGTVALKDSTGSVVDPAIKHPTDGYRISRVDDSTPAYYGFVDKTGKWYIMKEDSGSYLYFKGDSNFLDNWTNRNNLGYDDFNDIFGS